MEVICKCGCGREVIDTRRVVEKHKKKVFFERKCRQLWHNRQTSMKRARLTAPPYNAKYLPVIEDTRKSNYGQYERQLRRYQTYGKTGSDLYKTAEIMGSTPAAVRRSVVRLHEKGDKWLSENDNARWLSDKRMNTYSGKDGRYVSYRG